jgi:hypothetical protein
MKTELNSRPAKTVFLQTVGIALSNLKQRLQLDYERAYPELREVIHLVLDEEESRAWNLTLFPHLLLPDLVEAHIARLHLRAVKIRHGNVSATFKQDRFEHNQPVYSLCA